MDFPSGPDPHLCRQEEVVEEAAAITTSTTIVIEEIETVQIQAFEPAPHLFISTLLLDRFRSLLTIFVLSTFVLTFILQPFRIPSESMERTMLVGDFLLVNKSIFGDAGHWGWLLPYREPLHEDIVVFHFPLDPDDHVVKRLIGAPGDRISMRNGVVYRNDVPLVEPYTAQGHPLRSNDVFRDDFPLASFTDPGVDAHWWAELQRNVVQGELVVPAGRYFVMGDNRTFSRDSRYWGFVPRANIVGLPMLIYFSVREPSRTDREPVAAQDDRLGNSVSGRILGFARWDRIFRVVH